MVLTQAFGILLESVLVSRHWLGDVKVHVDVPDGIDPLGIRAFELRPYAEYGGLYLLLAELRGDEDTQGHLQRCVAQYFLTNNSLVSFIAAIGFTAMLTSQAAGTHILGGAVYLAAMFVGLVVTFRVARIRIPGDGRHYRLRGAGD